MCMRNRLVCLMLLLQFNFVSGCVIYAQNAVGQLAPAEARVDGERIDPIANPDKFPRVPRYADHGWSVLGLGGGGAMYGPSFSPFDSGLVLLATDMSATFRSENNGTKWELINRENNLVRMNSSTKPVYFHNRIYWPRGTSEELRYSDDKGISWFALTKPPWQKAKIISLCAVTGQKDVLLVGTESGLWRTDDHAKHWLKVHEQQFTDVIQVANVVYATDKAATLCASTDNGATWASVCSLKAYGEIKAMVGSSDGATESLFVSIKPAGLLRSIDQGKSWRVVKQPFAEETVLQMAPGQVRDIFAAQTGRGTLNKILRSTDGGTTWASVFRMTKEDCAFLEKPNVELSWVQTQLKWGYYITRNGFAINPLDPKMLIVTNEGDIYRSNDSGESWQQIMMEPITRAGSTPSVTNKSVGLEVTSAWGFYFDPHDANRQYIAYTDIGFAHSTDRGNSWTWSAKGSPWTNTFYDVVLDPAVPGRLYAAACALHDIPYEDFLRPIIPESYALHKKGGVVISKDSGQSWSVLTGKDPATALPAQICTTVAVDFDSSPEQRVIYTGLFGEGDNDRAGVYKSEDGGQTWRSVSKGLGTLDPNSGFRNLHIYRIRIHPVTKAIYCLITGLRGSTLETAFKIPGGIWKSVDGGESWQNISAGQNLEWHATGMSFDPKDPKVIYVSATSPLGRYRQGGVYRTLDDGRSWERIFPRDPKFDVPAYHLMSVTVHPNDPRLIYIGDEYEGLLYSADFGKSFQKFKGFPGRTVQSIVVDPVDEKSIYAATFGTSVWKGPIIPVE